MPNSLWLILSDYLGTGGEKPSVTMYHVDLTTSILGSKFYLHNIYLCIIYNMIQYSIIYIYYILIFPCAQNISALISVTKYPMSSLKIFTFVLLIKVQCSSKLWLCLNVEWLVGWRCWLKLTTVSWLDRGQKTVWIVYNMLDPKSQK